MINMSTATAIQTKTPFKLKGGLFTLTALQIHDYELENIAKELEQKIQQAPNFFHYAPLIIDISHLKNKDSLTSFQPLVSLMKKINLIPIGVRGAHASLKPSIIEAELAIFPEEKVVTTKAIDSKMAAQQMTSVALEAVSVEAQPTQPLTTRVITTPVRSGQQIYVPNGDLIVLNAVSPGAELLADGHIHVYGPLRGRALAGIMGNQEAMIFCKSLEAELVSVAGQYYVYDDLKEMHWKQSVCVKLHEDRLHIDLI